MHFSKRTCVTRGELAAELRVTKATIRQWEALRGFPALVRAPQRWPSHSGPNLVAKPISLPFMNRIIAPYMTVIL